MARRIKKCLDCGKSILETSKRCQSCAQKERFTRNGAWNKGKKRWWESPMQWVKGEPRLAGEKNYLWKGEKVSYVGLHQWVTRWKGKPCKCELCRTNELKKRGYDWANIDGEYKRDLDDYIRLCKSCHKKYDQGGVYL